MKERFRQWMIGRYGMDELGRFMQILVLALLLGGIFVPSRLTTAALILMVLLYFRMFSRDMEKRRRENATFLRLRSKAAAPFAGVRQRFTQRNTHRFYKCPACRQQLRVPKGKGTLSITCPKCQTRFNKTT